MPQVPTEMFVEACKAVVRANEYVPPYGTGGTLSSSAVDWCWGYYWGKTSRVYFHHLLLCRLVTILKVVCSNQLLDSG